MKKAAFIVIYLSLLGCASQQIATSHKKEVLSHQEEVITKIPNKPSLKGQVKRYKERSYTPIFQKLSQKDSIFFRWSETPYFEIEYLFDSKGNIVKEYQQVKEQTDSLCYISESKYLYNEKGKLMQKIFKEAAFLQKDNNQDEYIYYTNYIYDDKNNYFYKKIYNYDNENRQISYKKIYVTNGYKDEIKKNTWKYDNLGRIIEEYIYELSTTQHKEGTLIYNNAIRYYKYNTNGKLFEIMDQYLSDSILAQGATQGYTYYAYDLEGNLLCKSNFGDGKLRWRECYDACQHLIEEVYVSQEGETYRKQHYYQEDTYHNLIERLIISDSPVELSRYEIEYYRE